jgi:hypothetical protein
VPKGLLNAFYTKQARLGKGAGLAPFKLNKGISKADFLETFGIVEGKKAEGFDARSPQAQALKGIASLYGKLVTNEIVRSDTDLSLEAKQDVAAGKNKAMASKRTQKLDWKETDEAIVASFKIGDRTYKTTLEETAFMEFDEGQTYQDIEDIAKDLDILEDAEGDPIESSENFYHLEFGDTELGKGITGKGNAFEVFTTTMNGVVDYLKANPRIEGVVFTAKEPSRIRLYKTLSQVLAGKLNGSSGFKNDTFIVSTKPATVSKPRSMASKRITEEQKSKGIKDQIHQDSGKSLVSKTLSLLTRKDGVAAGFGNATLTFIATPFNLSSGGNSARRNYLAITDASLTRDKDRVKTEKALKEGMVFDLSKVRSKITNLGLSNSGPQFTTDQLKEMSLVAKGGSRSSIARNKEKFEALINGKNSLYDGFYKAYDANPEANLPGLKQIIYPADQSSNATLGRKMATAANDSNKGDKVPYLEHWFPYGQWALTTISTFDMPQASRDAWKKWANEHYYQENISSQTQTAVDKTYTVKLEDGTEVSWKSKDQNHPLLEEQLSKFRETGDVKYLDEASRLSDIRKYPGVHTEVNPFVHGRYDVTDAAKYGIKVSPSLQSNLEVQHEASAIIHEVIVGNITKVEAQERIEAFISIAPGKSMASKRDNDLIPDAIKYDRPITVQTAINALEKTDKALANGRKLDQPVKKIRVFDFDDTLARTKSNVLYTMPDGTTGKIDAATFAKEAGKMEAEGAQWDFSEFSKVMEGKKGPLLDVAKIIAEKRGTKDVFVLTARPADSAGPIKEFLASMGLDIPLANITGLGDGTPQAKAGWIMGKAAEGYNDFYFADDHTGNVKAVKDVLSQIDVKSKVQLAKASKRETFDTVVNDMIEDSSGIETYKKYSAARAKTVGASKGKYNFLIPPSAEDFTGLLYKMLGKGKKGDAQMAFLKTNLLDTYNRAESAVTQAKISAANDFVALKTKLKTLPKTLSKETGIGKFTYSHAVRVAAWTKQGMDIPGLSKRDVKELNDFVNKDAKLRVFTDELIKIQKGKEYPKPGKDWLGGNITTDIIGGINKVNRAEYQQEWRENIDIIFSEDNMNKMEAAYGTRWREAMEDSIRRMKSGSNRPIGGNRVTEGLLNWLNNSVGAVMFLNTRSALLQTISAVNFINLGDNNIIKAGKAFANQKQFWGDFMTLMNSDYLVERRNGLKINVSESEIADAVRESKNKPKAAIAFLLSKGFVMTRFADSFLPLHLVVLLFIEID